MGIINSWLQAGLPLYVTRLFDAVLSNFIIYYSRCFDPMSLCQSEKTHCKIHSHESSSYCHQSKIIIKVDRLIRQEKKKHHLPQPCYQPARGHRAVKRAAEQPVSAAVIRPLLKMLPSNQRALGDILTAYCHVCFFLFLLCKAFIFIAAVILNYLLHFNTTYMTYRSLS